MVMQTIQANHNVHETCLPMLRGAQTYLKALVNDMAPDSLVAEAWDDFYRVYDDLIRRFVVAQGVPRSDVDDCVQDVWGEVAARLAEFNRPADRPGLRAWLFTLVRAGFAKRRKMLRGSLAGLVLPEAFDVAGVEPTARAEELDVFAWGRLAAAAAAPRDAGDAS